MDDLFSFEIYMYGFMQSTGSEVLLIQDKYCINAVTDINTKFVIYLGLLLCKYDRVLSPANCNCYCQVCAERLSCLKKAFQNITWKEGSQVKSRPVPIKRRWKCSENGEIDMSKCSFCGILKKSFSYFNIMENKLQFRNR